MKILTIFSLSVEDVINSIFLVEHFGNIYFLVEELILPKVPEKLLKATIEKFESSNAELPLILRNELEKLHKRELLDRNRQSRLKQERSAKKRNCAEGQDCIEEQKRRIKQQKKNEGQEKRDCDGSKDKRCMFGKFNSNRLFSKTFYVLYIIQYDTLINLYSERW